ncbi:MAG: UDP-N-acetylmuramate--L-alanine ligase [Chitinophagales bacterium]
MGEESKIDKGLSSLVGNSGSGNVYFIGIGGIGMSAIARFFQSRGVKVSGYDKTPSALTKELEASGISIHYEDNIDLAPKDAALIVYTPAIPVDHKELVYYQLHGYKVVKRSDVLEMITESSFNICIAGTHGKTTITTMIAHLLRDSGYGCNAFLGGISVNYGTNFWSSDRNVCVIEADEYDRSFLKLNPDIAVITAMDADHLDIYGTEESVEQGFIDFSKKIKQGGLLVSKFGLKRGNDLKAARLVTYSLQNHSADTYAADIRMMNGSYEFDAILKGSRLENVKLNMGGLHNVENAVAAIAVASSLKIENEKIKAAVESFRGVKRRFEYIIAPSPSPQGGEGRGEAEVVFIDDYAHHPEELRALITGAKSLFSQMKCTVIFQPHLYTRTKDHADGFAEVLDLADEVVLLPVYPARELPIAGVNSEMILKKMKTPNKRVIAKEELTDWIKNVYVKKLNKDSGQVLVTAGAGDIDTLVGPIKKIIEKT